MTHPTWRAAAALGLALVAGARAQEAAEPTIKDFLADTGATYVGAAGIIGVDDKLVNNVATPKDFVVALRQGPAKLSKEGWGIAFAPGRSAFDLVTVDLATYESAKTDFLGKVGRRLWNSTTLSYAQNKKEVDKVEYTQRAYAVHLEYYPDAGDDPGLAAYRWIVGPWKDAAPDEPLACKALNERRQKAKAAPAPEGLLAQVSPSALGSPSARTKSEAPNLAAEYREARRRAAIVRTQEVITRAKGGAAASEAQARSDHEQDQQLIKDCAEEALEKSRAKWNASKLTVLWGRGTLRGPNADDPRLSLGTHVQLGYQFAPPRTTDSLVKFTAHRMTHALDFDTLGKTPAYRNRTLAALRYIYGHGPERKTYFLGEVSNVGSHNAGVASGAFKYALGLDKKIGDLFWLEVRAGRSVTRSADKEETKVLANIKYSFDSELASLK